MKNHFLAIGILSIAFFTSCKKEVTTSPDIEETEFEVDAQEAFVGGGTVQYVPNQLLVKFKEGTTPKERAKIIEGVDGDVAEHILTNAMLASGDNEGIYLLHTLLPVAEARMMMKGEDEIKYAEPNYIYQRCGAATVNDTYYKNGNLWGMYGSTTDPLNVYGSRAGEAWAKGHTGSASVYIGVIDGGAMYDHEDLSGQFWTNPFDAADGKDNDGNGFIDDIRGWDFSNNDKTTFDGIDDDHGTHVSGIIGAKGNNRKGANGVNWNITLISAKFLGPNGGTTANAIKAVDYFTALKLSRGLNIVATNNSWAGGGFSQGLQDAITRAGVANILFIAAAANDGMNTENSPSYPSGYDNTNIIAVASLNADGIISYFSNYAATRVDIAAPGGYIYSSVPAIVRGKLASAYSAYSGTSMATPHVTGAAALYASTHPGATAAQIKSAILNSAIPTASLTGKCVTGGRLNMSGF